MAGSEDSVRWEESKEEVGNTGGGAVEETSKEVDTGSEGEGELTRLDNWRTPPLKSFRDLLKS